MRLVHVKISSMLSSFLGASLIIVSVTNTMGRPDAIFNPFWNQKEDKATEAERLQENIRHEILKSLLTMGAFSDHKAGSSSLKTCSFTYENEALEQGVCTRQVQKECGELFNQFLQIRCVSVSWL